VAPAAANGYCCSDCPGYEEEPHAGHLWPGENLYGIPAPIPLSPCPFCGAGYRPPEDCTVNGVQLQEEGYDDGSSLFYVSCGTCVTEGPAGGTTMQAAEKWNRRPAPPISVKEGDGG
jgi:hypothetical protein